ncbi:hypothetical protein HA402_009677 [Bradysia odoriphaga]|nr:hypothetical protein HA402_009677 [Bradysia odoriphaga]
MSTVVPSYLGTNKEQITIVHPDDPFNMESFVKPAALKNPLQPQIEDFMKNWSVTRIVENYARLHPLVNRQVLLELMTAKPTFILYSGVDLIYSKDLSGHCEFLMIESNVYPGGQDAMPPSVGSYESHLSCILNDDWKGKPIETGGLAYIYGMNTRRARAIPHFMAKISKEPIHVVPLFNKRADEKIERMVRCVDGTMQVKSQDDWLNMRACFSSVSYRPWTYIPVTNNLKTYMNPHPIAALVGKSKILSEYALRDFNQTYSKHGIQIRGPRTMVGITKEDVGEIVEQNFQGRAVVKTPYDSQGRGIYVIRSKEDFDNFYTTDQSDYSLWVVQELIEIGECQNSRYQQVGYNLDNHLYACTVRIIASSGPCGFKMTAIRGARAPEPFAFVGSDNARDPNSLSSIETINEDAYITNIGTNSDSDSRAVTIDDAAIKGLAN